MLHSLLCLLSRGRPFCGQRATLSLAAGAVGLAGHRVGVWVCVIACPFRQSDPFTASWRGLIFGLMASAIVYVYGGTQQQVSGKLVLLVNIGV